MDSVVANDEPQVRPFTTYWCDEHQRWSSQRDGAACACNPLHLFTDWLLDNTVHMTRLAACEAASAVLAHPYVVLHAMGVNIESDSEGD